MENKLKFDRVKKVGIFTKEQLKSAVFNKEEFKQKITGYNTVPYGCSSTETLVE